MLQLDKMSSKFYFTFAWIPSLPSFTSFSTFPQLFQSFHPSLKKSIQKSLKYSLILFSLGPPFKLADLTDYVFRKHLGIVSFTDGAGISGTFRPLSRELDMSINQPNTRFDELPKNLWGYTIRLSGDAVATVEDIETIFQWENVQILQIIDNNDVAIKLSQRIDQLPHYINRLMLTVQQNSYKQLDVSKFCSMPLINTLIFEAGCDLSDMEFDEFVSNQSIPSDFSTEHNGRSVIYKNLKSW